MLSDDYGTSMVSSLYVYDTETDRFGIACGSSSEETCLLPHGYGSFPMNNNLPQTNARRNKIFTIGGDCDER